MFRFFILPFLLLFTISWVLAHALVVIIELAYALVCFFIMVILALAFLGLAGASD
jgi:hypothetical protein